MRVPRNAKGLFLVSCPFLVQFMTPPLWGMAFKYYAPNFQDDKDGRFEFNWLLTEFGARVSTADVSDRLSVLGNNAS